MTKMLYQKPDLQIIEIETEEVIATSPGEGSGKPGSGGNGNPSTRSNGYVNSLDNRDRWSDSEL
ncbi:MAG: hypothetical protein RR212_10910 [Bacteroidales bacterium]